MNNINSTSTDKTIEMQKTGIPLYYLILALLMVLGGITGFKID